MKNKNHLFNKMLLIFFTVVLFLNTGRAEIKNPISLNSEGWDYLKKGDSYKAIFSFKNALNKNSKYRDALLGLGRAYYEVGALEPSIDMYSQALKIDKNSDSAMIGLGLIFTQLGKFTLAMEYFNHAVKISEENADAKYGIANLYYNMEKFTWTRRKVDGILKIHPYHTDTLFLMADLKIRDNRLADARKYVEKAIDVNSESPRGYVKLGEILFRDYISNDREESLESAVDALKNALSIQPASYHAGRIMGNIYFYQGNMGGGDKSADQDNYQEAIHYYKISRKAVNSPAMLYSLAAAYDRHGDADSALEYFLLALKEAPFDPILIGRLEDFLVFRDIKIGHPSRDMLNKENFRLAARSMERNLADDSILYLRRALLLNPMDRGAREALIGYYSALDYNRFYIDELKNLLRMYPEKKYQDMLEMAVMKRRERLYHREGFSSEFPVRDVPRILVMNFDSSEGVSEHPDAGEVMANALTFTMNQFGRMSTAGFRKRVDTVRGLSGNENHLMKSMESIGSRVRSGKLEPVDYIVYGSYYERNSYISLNIRLIDFSRGVVIDEFSMSESGKDSLLKLSLRAVRRMYNIIPYKGRILKLNDEGIIVNLGLYDGISPGDKYVVYKYNNSSEGSKGVKQKLIFTVSGVDTLISSALPEKKSDLEQIFASDQVFPLKRRRAKLVK